MLRGLFGRRNAIIVGASAILGGGSWYAWGTSTMASSVSSDETSKVESVSTDSPKDSGSLLTSKFTYYTGPTLSGSSNIRVFAGTGHRVLADDVAKYLGVDLGQVCVTQFADGECSIKVNENVRGKHVVIIQSTCPPNVNDTLVELLLIVSTMRRSSAKKITVVMPYCGYMRSDMKRDMRSPIAARDVMTMLETVGMDRLICIDMHSGQMQGFLSPGVPSDNITAVSVGALFFSEIQDLSQNLVVAAPDEMQVGRAKEFWNVLLQRGKPEARFAMVIRKPSLEEKPRKLKMMKRSSAERRQELEDIQKDLKKIDYEVVGDENLEGCDVILVQDIIDSAQSISNAATALKASGAKRVFGFATHGLFSNEAALNRIREAPIDRIVVSNTASHRDSESFSGQKVDKITWISVAPLVAEAIRRVCGKESLSPLFALPPKTSEE